MTLAPPSKRTSIRSRPDAPSRVIHEATIEPVVATLPGCGEMTASCGRVASTLNETKASWTFPARSMAAMVAVCVPSETSAKVWSNVEGPVRTGGPVSRPTRDRAARDDAARERRILTQFRFERALRIAVRVGQGPGKGRPRSHDPRPVHGPEDGNRRRSIRTVRHGDVIEQRRDGRVRRGEFRAVLDVPRPGLSGRRPGGSAGDRTPVRPIRVRRG